MIPYIFYTKLLMDHIRMSDFIFIAVCTTVVLHVLLAIKTIESYNLFEVLYYVHRHRFNGTELQMIPSILYTKII